MTTPRHSENTDGSARRRKRDAAAHLSIGHLSNDLTRHTVRGGAATMTAQAVKFVLQLGSTVILARLLTPDDFGVVGMVMAFVAIGLQFKDLGLSTATIQRDDIEHDQVSMLFWINMLLGLVFAAVIAALAPVLGYFYGDPRVVSITLAFALLFLFGGLTVQHQALLRRQMRFIVLAGIEVLGLAVGIGAAIVAALLGLSYWALVAMHVGNALVLAAGVWIACGWRPSMPRRGVELRSIVLFGANISGYTLLSQVRRNIDKALIGWRWTAADVGLYSKAYQLLLLPIQQINAPVSAVAVPTLSRLQNDPERYAKVYYKLLKTVSYMTMPLVATMIVFAPEVIHIVLGPQWTAAVPIFSILGIIAFLQPIVNTNGWILVSLNQADRLLKWGAISTPLIALAFVCGLPWGASGVALAYAIVFFLLVIPGMMFSYARSPLSLGATFGSIQLPMLLTFLYAGIALGIRQLLFGDFGQFARLSGSVAVAAGLILGLTLLWSTSRRDIFEVIRYTRQIFEKPDDVKETTPPAGKPFDQ
jgi:PST family polysaccharide transporter